MDNLPSQSHSSIENSTVDRMQNIIVGQKVTAEKLELAKQLRQKSTQTEGILWQYLRGHKCNGLKFRRQQIIDGFIVDFYCHSARLVVEIDGEIHQQQIEYDLEREAVLKDRGLRILRFTNHEVLEQIDRVLLMIAEACL